MRTTLALTLSVAFALSTFVGCGGDEEAPEAYDTLQDCFVDHTDVESLPVVEALVICCLEHPIAGVAPSCSNTEAECVTHVTSEIDAADATATEIEDACAEYIVQKNM